MSQVGKTRVEIDTKAGGDKWKKQSVTDDGV